MTKDRLKQILLGLGVGTIAIAGLLYYLQGTQVKNFGDVTTISLEDSLVKYGSSTTTAKNLDDYFSGKKSDMSIKERDEWINIFNEANKTLKISIGSFSGKELVIKMNEIIKQGAAKIK